KELQYKAKEALWLENQALVLAAHLEDGKACPVCGSTHHPNKISANEQEISKEQLDGLKKSLENLHSEVNYLQSVHRANQHTFQQARERLQAYGNTGDVTESTLQQLKIQGTQMRNQMNQMEKVKKKLQSNKEA